MKWFSLHRRTGKCPPSIYGEQRELKGLLEAMRRHKIPKGGILTYDQEEVRTINGMNVPLMPVWKWLLLSRDEEKSFL